MVAATALEMPVQQDLFAQSVDSAPRPAAENQAVALAGHRSIMLVDASGFIFRAYHALPALTTSKGVPTHAVLGFTRMMLKLLRERAPTHLALCFDKDSRRGRLAIDPNYKANREAPPADLVTQFALIRQIAQVLNLPILEVEGWEADDVIATMVTRARAAGFQSEIITSDKDFLQLLAPDVRIYDAMKDRPIDEAAASAKFGIRPQQMRDYQALVGDAIDNIPKVPGIGPKTATDLLVQFGSVEALLTRIDEVKKPKIREALAANEAQLRRALDLVSFRDTLPLTVEPEALVRKPIHQAEARALLTELEFYRLLSEMPAPPSTPLRQEANLVVDRAGLEAMCAELTAASTVALAPAFEGEAHSAVLVGLGVMVSGGGCFYVDVATLGAQALAEGLGPSIRREGLALSAHDAKAALHVLATVGIEPLRIDTDVELLSYLLNPSRREHAVSDIVRERLRIELPPWPDAASGRGRAPMSEISVPTLAAMFAARADAIERIGPELWAEVDGVGLGAVARELEVPLIWVLTKMERAGIAVDLAALREISHQVDASIDGLLAEVYLHAGHEFNAASPPQLAQVLYEELKLPVLKKNKTGPSTDQEVLEKLAEQHPLPRAIIEYRNVAKLKNTYLDTLPSLVGRDGRVRTTFHQAAAATGRLSSSNPNLQNIPIRTELGRQIRRAFVAGPGNVLLSADYSQIELRILAHISGDAGLVTAFAEGADVHARTAAEVFSVPVGEVSDEQRRAAKMVNYGIAYGLSPHGLKTRLNISGEEAKSIIDRYFERFPGIAGYIEQTVEKAKRSGFVESLFGRRRAMPDLGSRNRAIAGAAERAAINMPIQGTAADLVKRAMLQLDAVLPTSQRMLLQVHDELLFECPASEADGLTETARRIMTSVTTFSVPLVVDIGIGHSWSDAH